jgi:hypothetical protein
VRTLPTADEISAWLRERVRKPRPGPVARFLGEPEEFSYRVHTPIDITPAFVVSQVLFRVHAEQGLLPFPSLPHGSWGIFAADEKAIQLLEPHADAMSVVLARENRPLDEGNATELAQLFSLLVLTGLDGTHHKIVASAEQIAQFRWGMIDGYEAAASTLRSVASKVTPPAVTGSASRGWNLTFVTVAGWMHELYELGVENVTISPNFRVHRQPRQILAAKIFRKVPGLTY